MTAPSPAVLLCMLNLCFIAALPRIFFRRGRLNAQWWLTAAPFVLAGVALLQTWLAPEAATIAGATTTVDPRRAVIANVALALDPAPALQLAAVLFAAASIALIAFTLGTHSEPVSLWHQPDDRPARLVMHGAYARIRHPFYSAFLLGLAACVCAAPGLLSGLAAAMGALQLTRTARREERRLGAAFGGDYVAYMLRTGRFLPRLIR